MAHEPDLRDLLKGLEATPQEMAAYRMKLADTLSQTKVSPWWRMRSLPLFALSGVVLLAFLLWPKTPVLFEKQRLTELQTLVEQSDHNRLQERAEKFLGHGSDLNKWNALTVLCMTLPPREAIPLAGKALEEDPRSEFRAFYLEFLLDKADDYPVNTDRIEALMDKEEDELCLRLYRDLLNIS